MNASSLQESINTFYPNDFINKSKKIQSLGSGTFGYVALYDTPSGRYVIKETKVEDKSLGYPSDFLAEVDMLIKLRFIKNVVSIQGVCFSDNRKKGYIILEPLDSNLSEWSRRTPFNERMKQLPNIIKTIGSTIAIMHHFSFVHNDIKPNNILVKEDVFKLADFGNSLHITNPNIQCCWVEQYRPPARKDIYVSEFWAFMVSLVEVITGKKVVTDFYRPYWNGIKFDLSTYIKSSLEDDFRLIPSIFWKFINPLINGKNVTISDCLLRIGIALNTNLIGDINENISKMTEIKVIDYEFKNRLTLLHVPDRFERFTRLYNKFLSLTPELNDKRYAEVAFAIVARSKAVQFEYFQDLSTFLLFQRTFLMTIGYQINII
jgi:serine/threonine protein kinase